MPASGDLNIPWIDLPHFEKLLDESALDAGMREKAKFFAREGYLLIDLEISDLDDVAAEIVTACSKQPDYDVRVTDAWESIPGVKRLALLPSVLSLLQALYRRTPVAMQTLNFARGTEQKPHSDAFHFNSVPPGFMCGVWIALEEIDDRNGPLLYYPRSHKLPYLEHMHYGLTASRQSGHELYPAYEEQLGRVLDKAGLEPLTISMPAGHALVWAANLAHGGAPIVDRQRTRHSQITHYFFEDCLYYQPQKSDVFLGRIEWLDKKSVATGDYLPQVYNGRSVRVPMRVLERLKRTARRSALAPVLRHVKRKISP